MRGGIGYDGLAVTMGQDIITWDKVCWAGCHHIRPGNLGRINANTNFCSEGRTKSWDMEGRSISTLTVVMLWPQLLSMGPYIKKENS